MAEGDLSGYVDTFDNDGLMLEMLNCKFSEVVKPGGLAPQKRKRK
jgi:hypothetical protein